MSKRAEESRLCVYQLEGAQTLGSCIRIRPRANNAPDLSKCSIQWYRVSSESEHKETIAGDYLRYASLTFLTFVQSFCTVAYGSVDVDVVVIFFAFQALCALFFRDSLG